MRQPRGYFGIPFGARILIGLGLGLVAGLVFGERTAPLARLGSVILDLIRALAAPLILFAILDAFLRTEVRARQGGLLIALAACNAALALGIGLALANGLQPGRWLRLETDEAYVQARGELERLGRHLEPDRRIDFWDELLRLVPGSVGRPFVENQLLSIVGLAVLGGAALRRVKAEQQARGETGYQAVEGAIATAYRASEVMIGWVVQAVPLAILGVVAATVGRFGLEPVRGLAVYLGVGLLGLLIQVGVVYQAWIVGVLRRPLRWFWRGASEAVIHAMGTGSSLATLPVTLRSLSGMGVSPRSARLAACVGTNLNNDGILLYEAMAVLFVAQACGVNLDLGSQLLAAGCCLIAGIGISGVPEAGLISLVVVLRTVRVIPEEQVALVVPLLLTVDWILGRARAATNVTSDILLAALLDRLDPPQGEDDPAISDPDGI
ncbi:MAG: hypothetical protein KatS3mg108_3730 [Isosphaeraceae bacterium]|nr:MAG: hypothetical protein KatS3mg108_3730 [Isosphaeraceae bacterium]